MLSKHTIWTSNRVIFFPVYYENYSITSNWGFSMTTCHPRGSLNLTMHHRHIISTHCLSFSILFLLISLDSHCIFTSVTSCSPPSVQRWQSEEPIFTKLLLVLLFHSLSCLTCCHAKPGTVYYLLQKNNYRETPASLKLTVSFPASFLLNTMCTLLAFLIINSRGSIQQE